MITTVKLQGHWIAENKNLKIIFTKLFDRLCRMFGKIHFFINTQLIFTCSNSKIEILKKLWKMFKVNNKTLERHGINRKTPARSVVCKID